MIRLFNGKYLFDGAGVRLFRVFSHGTEDITDPFLLLDHFGSDNSNEYLRGFPWHPHRGIETVTYMLRGEVEHGDNIGNKGIIAPGDIQWMSAGSGIIHQEMPTGNNGMYGLQLWVNMPKSKKMSQPRYRGIRHNELPIIKKEGIDIKVIAGDYDGKKGPAIDLVIDILYIDVTATKPFEYSPKKDHTTFCYIIDGRGRFQSSILKEKQMILFRDIDTISVEPYDKMRFILVSGMPLKEPVAWGGSIVMNTQEELDTAYDDIKKGTFIKNK